MKVTITIVNDSPGDKQILIEQAIIGGTITNHFLQHGHSMTVETTAWPLKIMDSLSGRF